ncbi:MAG: Vi polysaccharide biosynthesis protein VipA/TviB [Bacteroidetes bacterium]|nr:MAG: Vi polysaccharide biosynthesis protein VipA/TviB [Bacteroidota bacterium]
MNLLDQKIAVVGLGYVGLPLAVEFGKLYDTTGFDISQGRIDELERGEDSTLEVEPENLKSSTHLSFSMQLEDIKDCTIYIVTVPTPIDKNKRPDLTPLEKSSQSISKVLKKGDIVIYESTVFPGCTEEVCVPILEEGSGLKFNQDFYCGYSPERINPGDKVHTVTKIKKVTSGSTPEIAEVVDQLYKSVITAGTYKASSLKVAEAAKVIENCQRDINIAFINELSLIFDKLGIDTLSVLEAAGTKWNFLPFRPGLVGGHCIGVDPYYLTYKAQEVGYNPQVILSGRRINDAMGAHVASKVTKLMIDKDLAIKGSKALMLGITFKENCPDIRNSKAIDVYHELSDFGLDVDVYDPWANAEEVKNEYGLDLLTELGSGYSSIILAVSHTEFESIELHKIKAKNSVIFDIKSFFDPSLVDARL